MGRVHSAAILVFDFEAPWQLQDTLHPSECSNSEDDTPEWHCAAFSPRPDVDQLALSSTSHLCVVDFSKGWGSRASWRTHSLWRRAAPTSMSYSACGTWI